MIIILSGKSQYEYTLHVPGTILSSHTVSTRGILIYAPSIMMMAHS